MSASSTASAAKDNCPVAASIAKLASSLPANEYVNMSPSLSVAVTGAPKTAPLAVVSKASTVNSALANTGVDDAAAVIATVAVA